AEEPAAAFHDHAFNADYRDLSAGAAFTRELRDSVRILLAAAEDPGTADHHHEHQQVEADHAYKHDQPERAPHARARPRHAVRLLHLRLHGHHGARWRRRHMAGLRCCRGCGGCRWAHSGKAWIGHVKPP